MAYAQQDETSKDFAVKDTLTTQETELPLKREGSLS